MPLNPLHHTIIATDVAGSGSRHDALLVRMRADLRQILRETLSRQGLSVEQLTTIDLGDGYAVLLPASVSPGSALDPFVANLTTALRLHREASSEANRLRLRVAIHSGLLHREEDGAWTGTPLKDCARLLDAQAGRDILAAAPHADAVFLVSRTVHDSVVRHGYTVDPALFHRIRVTVKETDEDAWAHVPGSAPPPGPPAARPPDPTPAPRMSSVTISGGAVINAPVTGGDYHGGTWGSGAR